MRDNDPMRLDEGIMTKNGAKPSTHLMRTQILISSVPTNVYGKDERLWVDCGGALYFTRLICFGRRYFPLLFFSFTTNPFRSSLLSLTPVMVREYRIQTRSNSFLDHTNQYHKSTLDRRLHPSVSDL
ncbi:hypothetical protein L1887_11004 [Cichorium endivia]|nr:hypothetical protein L1887_11004 [Cichorium endivia]